MVLILWILKIKKKKLPVFITWIKDSFFLISWVSVLFWGPVCFGLSLLCQRIFSNVQWSLALCSRLVMGLKVELEALHVGRDWGLVAVTVTWLCRSRLCCWRSLCGFMDFSGGSHVMAHTWLSVFWLLVAGEKVCNQRVHPL